MNEKQLHFLHNITDYASLIYLGQRLFFCKDFCPFRRRAMKLSVVVQEHSRCVYIPGAPHVWPFQAANESFQDIFHPYLRRPHP